MWKITTLVLALCTAGPQFYAEAEKVKASIYYESLCPDSTRFVINQVNGSYSEIGDYLDLDWIPFGNANQKWENGAWHFKCQHGPQECHGNKMQACAIYQGLSQEKTVEFISCVMGSGNPADDSKIETCAERTGFSWSEIQNCSQSSLGDNLLAEYGKRTLAADPLITSVPTVFFNDKYDPFLQTEALIHFIVAVCSAMKDKPNVCPSKKRDWWDPL